MIAYFNDHWFGDERTRNDNIPTFDKGTIFPSRTAAKETKRKKLTIYLDDELIMEKEL